MAGPQPKNPKIPPAARAALPRGLRNFNWRLLAPYALGLGLAALVAGIALYFVRRAFDPYVITALAVGLVGLLAFAYMDPGRLLRWIGSRQVRYGSNVLVMSLAFLGILVVLNFLSYRHSKRWDLTENKQFTLAPETIQTLQSLTEPAQARAYYTTRSASSRDTAKKLLDQYQLEAKGKFSYRFIDPEADPAAATADGVTRDATVVVAIGSRKESMSSPTEQDLTSALVRLANPGERKLYFLTGHGEADPAGSDDPGLKKAADMLTSQNYTIASLNLLVEKKVPQDARAVVIAGSDKPLAQAEVDALSAYLAQGGGLVVLSEPRVVTHFGDAADPLADYLAREWGVTLQEDMVVDTSSQQAFNAIAAQYGQSPITDKLSRTVTIFPTARSLKLAPPQGKSLTQVALVQTGSASWGETDMAALQNSQPSFDPKTDYAGPVVLAATVESTSPKARVVVFGDSDFGRNANFDAYGNGDLLVNSISWTAQEENLINLAAKTPTTRVLAPPSTMAINLILLTTVCLLPGAFVVAGAGVWFVRRRHK